MLDLLGELRCTYLFLLLYFIRESVNTRVETFYRVPYGILSSVRSRTLKLNLLFCSNMVKGGYFSVFYSSEFRPSILAYLGSNVYLVYNFLHPASQRGEVSFPCISTYMSLWRCGPFCTSGEFQGNIFVCFILFYFLNCS